MDLEQDTYRRPASMKHLYFNTKKFSLPDLTEQEKEAIFQQYGFKAMDVQPLTPSQEWFFSRQDFISPEFYLQALYKLQGYIEPQRLTEEINQLVQADAVLRTNFLQLGKRVVRVILNQRQPQIVYHTLEHLSGSAGLDHTLASIMEADRRRGFDLAKDHLLRLAVFRTGMKEYAVLVTQPQIIADSWDIRELFEHFFVGQELAEVQLPLARKFSFEQYLALKKGQDKAPAVRYWQKLLAGLPALPTLPGYEPSYQDSHQEAALMRLPEEDVKRACLEAGGDRMYLMAILHTAWGLLLQAVNGTEDTYFCLIASNRHARLDNIGETAGILNVMLVRCVYEPPCRIKDMVKKQFAQTVVSQPFSYCEKTTLHKLSGSRPVLFNHFLSFHGFLEDTRTYSQTQGVAEVVPVMVNSFDAQGMDLGIYFRREGDNISAEFVYNDNCFAHSSIEYLMDRYATVLHLLLANWLTDAGKVRRLLAVEESRPAVDIREKQVSELTGFLHSVPILEGISAAALASLAAQTEIIAYLENDRIVPSSRTGNKILLVMHGKVCRNRDSGGWLSLLDIVSERQLIDEYVFQTGERGQLVAEALSSRVVVAAIPLSAWQEIADREPALVRQVINHLTRELDKYQKRWLLE